MKRLASIVRVDPPGRLPLTLDDEAAAREHATLLTARNMRGGTLVILGATLVCWALDPVVFRDSAEVVPRLAWVRAFHAASSIAAFLALRSPWLSRRPMLVAWPAAIFDVGLLGALAGMLGGLSAPWFHCFYLVVFASLLAVVGLGARVAFTTMIPASLLGGFAVVRPLRLGEVMLVPTLAFLVVLSVAAIGLGHLVFRLVRRDFLQTRAERRARRAIDELNATLERRVREQTRELRLLAEHLERAREDERARISRELHDELGQELTSMRYAMTVFKQRYERDPASARGLVEQIDALLVRTTRSARQIVTELRPRVLDDLGLDAGVEWLIERTRERTGLTSRLTIERRDVDLDGDLSIAAFRILQEALTNVVRHAQATCVDVEVAVDGEHLRLEVRDDGVGMPAESARRPPLPGRGGMGLIGMRERSESLGGRLEIESRRGRGTTLRALLPVVRREPAGAQEVRA